MIKAAAVTSCSSIALQLKMKISKYLERLDTTNFIDPQYCESGKFDASPAPWAYCRNITLHKKMNLRTLKRPYWSAWAYCRINMERKIFQTHSIVNNIR